MIREETPERMNEANDARWQEYGKLRRMERKLQGKILEYSGKGPPSPEPMFHQELPRSNPRERGEHRGLAGHSAGEDAEAGWRID